MQGPGSEGASPSSSGICGAGLCVGSLLIELLQRAHHHGQHVVEGRERHAQDSHVGGDKQPEATSRQRACGENKRAVRAGVGDTLKACWVTGRACVRLAFVRDRGEEDKRGLRHGDTQAKRSAVGTYATIAEPSVVMVRVILVD
jgi:hypothetical protein